MVGLVISGLLELTVAHLKAKKAVTVLTLRAFGEMTGDSDQQLVMKKLSSIPYLQEWSTDTCE